jgi:antitoxin component YwqK of YwqJK toxin-antitoxin module
MIRLLFLFLSAQLLLTGNPNPVNEQYKKQGYTEGENKLFYASGRISEKFTIKNGNLHGTDELWYKNGQLREIDHFDNGKFIDTCRQFFEDGNLSIEDVYKHDTMLYYSEYHYYKNGNRKTFRYLAFDKDSLKICPFLGVKVTGHWIDFDVNLTVESMKGHGMYIEYFKTGNKQLEIDLVNNKYEGESREYYEDGKLFCVGPYHNDLSEGAFTFYNKDGTVMKTENWKNGKLVK